MIKKNLGIKLYGIIGYYGLNGSGKTMAIAKQLQDYRKKYGNNIYIATNFGFKDEDFALESWKDLLKSYDKALVVALDECPNEFSSREYKSFPILLMSILTQLRKNNTIQILYASQQYHMVDKNFRTLSMYSCDCHTIAGCYTTVKKYDNMSYEMLKEKTDVNLKMKIKPVEYYSFLQTPELRNSYDSFKMLDSSKMKQYMDREELAVINGKIDVE